MHPSFSLTEKYLTDPILTWRAPLPPLEPKTWTAKIKQGFQSEMISRVAGLAVSFFAAADSLIQLFTAIYKGWTAKKYGYTKGEIQEHFQRAAVYAALALIGSPAAFVWPDFLKQSRYQMKIPQEAPEKVRRIYEAEPVNIPEIEALWQTASLETRHWFVHLFSQDGPPKLKAIRTQLADRIFQPASLSKRKVQWLSSGEITEQLRSVRGHLLANHSFYFHATSEKALESILKSGRIEVRHEKAFKGAFVSNHPETSFGRCILVFKKDIERLSPLEQGFYKDHHTYWAGFSRDIPVTPNTLAYIMLQDGTLEQCTQLQEQCRKWTGWPIEVIPSGNGVQEKLTALENLDMGIPKEWPGPDDDQRGMGKLIFNTLQARAQALQVQNQVAVSPLQQRVHLPRQRQMLYA